MCVLCIGVGGLGLFVFLYFVVVGVGIIGIIDGDYVDELNL